MNEIATVNSNLPAELQNLGTNLIQEGATAGGGISDLLRFLSRDGGIWAYGQENVEVEDIALWAVNPLSFEHGYVCWKNKKIAGEVMVAVGVAAPARSTLEDHGTYVDGKGNEIQTSWDEQMSIRLKCVNGEDTGVEVNYKTSTYGGLQCIKNLAKAVGARINSGVGDVVAVVELANDHYNHKDHGKTYTPLMTVQKWLDMQAEPVESDDEIEPGDDEGEVVEEKPKPRKRGGRKAATASSAAAALSERLVKETEPEKPVRRRRARSA